MTPRELRRQFGRERKLLRDFVWKPRTTQPERELAILALADGGRTMQPQSEQAVAILEIAGEMEVA